MTSTQSARTTFSSPQQDTPDNEETPIRSEPRQAIVHLVEWSRYPRRTVGEKRGVAYTQDRSDSGLGLDLPEPVRPNELLNITLRDIDGKQSLEGLARVVWSRPGDGDRFRAGLSLLREEGERPLFRVRRRGVLGA